eukprot:scaffold5881_cov262-Alexandrium_tamarense.AAC.1
MSHCSWLSALWLSKLKLLYSANSITPPSSNKDMRPSVKALSASGDSSWSLINRNRVRGKTN